VSRDILRAFVIGPQTPNFCSRTTRRLTGEVNRLARTAQSIYTTMQSLPEGSPERAKAILAANEQTVWLVEQIDGLTARFRNVLKLDKHSRSRLGWLW
jgi:hypothetical protein